MNNLAAMQQNNMAPIAGRYAVLEQVGQGGTATVFQALDMQTHQKVVLKHLNLSPQLDPATRQSRIQSFRNECQILQLLDHPHILKVLDILEGDDQFCMVTEWVDGVTLDAYMRVNPPMPGPVLNMIDQVCDGLEYMHARGVVHRDIKPENIMITSSGQIKILDFGLARIGGSAFEDQEASMAGTVAYMAPELLKNKQLTEFQSDIYALGITLYELLTGRVPYEGSDPGSAIFAIMNSEAPPPLQFNPMIGPDLNHLVMTCIHKQPQHRFANCRQLRQLLRVLSSRVFYEGADPMLAMNSVLPPIQTFDRFELVDELHNFVHSHESGQLLVWNACEEGGIWLQNGNILHADIKNKNLDGMETLFTILSWESGNFLHIPTAQVGHTSIKQNAFKVIEDADAYLAEYKLLWEMYQDVDCLELIMQPGKGDPLSEAVLLVLNHLEHENNIGALAAELPLSRKDLLEAIKSLDDRRFIFVDRTR